MIEMHPNPIDAKSDKDQANSFEDIQLIISNIKKVRSLYNELD